MEDPHEELEGLFFIREVKVLVVIKFDSFSPFVYIKALGHLKKLVLQCDLAMEILHSVEV